MKVLSGFTFIRNCKKYDFPFQESVESMLPILDELVVNVGASEDGTEDFVADLLKKWKIQFPKVEMKRIDRVWDDEKTQSGLVLSEQTNMALNQCTAPWALYLQGDEAIHEKDYGLLRSFVEDPQNLEQWQGCRLKYYHFYGGFVLVQRALKWYPSEIRIIRNNGQALSFGDAQTFRDLNGNKLKTKLIDANIYHYGHARHPEKMKEKIKYFHRFWHGDHHGIDTKSAYNLEFRDLIWFAGKHPKSCQSRVEKAKIWDPAFQKKADLKGKTIRIISGNKNSQFTDHLIQTLENKGATVNRVKKLSHFFSQNHLFDVSINLELGEKELIYEYLLTLWDKSKIKIGHCRQSSLPRLLKNRFNFVNWKCHENIEEGINLNQDQWQENLVKWVLFSLSL